MERKPTRSMAGSRRAGKTTLAQLMDAFPSDRAAEDWFARQRWPDGVRCAHCRSENVRMRKGRKPQPYHCRDCRRDFSVKTDTLMHGSPKGCRIWAIMVHLAATELEDASFLKLHRDLGITQRSAWFAAHRIRETYDESIVCAPGAQTMADEFCTGALEAGAHARRRRRARNAAGSGRLRGGRPAP